MKRITIIIFTLFFYLLVGVILLVSINAVSGNGPLGTLTKLNFVSGSPFESSLTRSRFVLDKTIVDDHTFILDKYAVVSNPDILYAHGHYYSVFIPGAVFLDVPLYFIGRQFNLGVFFSNLISPIAILLTIFVLNSILKKFTIPLFIRYLAIFLMIFGTVTYSYSTTLTAHSLSALFITLALYAGIQIFLENKWITGYPLFWLAFGLAFICDYPNAIILFPLVIVLLFRALQVHQGRLKINAHFFLSFSFALLSLVPLFLYIYHLFGTIFTTIEPHQIQGYIQNGKDFYTFIFNPSFFLTHTPFYKTLTLDPHNLPMGLYALLISPQRGIFIYSPIFLLAFFGIRSFINQHKTLAWTTIWMIILTVFSYAAYSDYVGGWAYGPRFFIPIMPIIAIFLAYSIHTYYRNLWFFFSFILLGLWSICVSLLGTFTTKLLPSPIEKGVWGLHYVFWDNVPSLTNSVFTSYIYDTFLKHVFSRIDFILIVFLSIVLCFLLLSLGVFAKRREHV